MRFVSKFPVGGYAVENLNIYIYLCSRRKSRNFIQISIFVMKKRICWLFGVIKIFNSICFLSQ